MKKLLQYLVVIMALFSFSMPSFAALNNGVWVNDARSMFLQNKAIIMAINIRTFNANDKNKNDIAFILLEEYFSYFKRGLINLLQGKIYG